MLRNRLSALGAAAVLLVGAACSEVAGVGDVAFAPTAPADLVGDRNEVYTVMPGVVNVCAFFPYLGGPEEGNRTASFTASAPAGEDVIAGVYAITPVPSCIEVWNASSTNTVDVAAAVAGAQAGYEIDRIVTSVGDGLGDATFQEVLGTSSASVTVNSTVGGFIWFKFKQVELPPPGGQGCTPGYWKQSQHFDSWTAPYTPSTQFSAVFADAFPGKTLLQVLSLGGGGVNALGRHAVAALLDGASSGVNYDLTTTQVIADFNAAYTSGDKKRIEQQKNVFDFLNNQGCPLN